MFVLKLLPNWIKVKPERNQSLRKARFKQWGRDHHYQRRLGNPTHLLCLERELNEDLLQLLVHVIDAELLKSIALEDFEPVNVQDANVELPSIGVHGIVDDLERRLKGPIFRYCT